MTNSKMFAGRAPQAHGGMVELEDGRWMMVWSGLNVSYSKDRGRTDDEGESWSEEVSINLPGETASNYHDVLFQLQSGRLYQSISEDEGLTWSLPQPTELASSYSPCRLRTIPTSGDLLCVWNQVSGDEIRRVSRIKAPRIS